MTRRFSFQRSYLLRWETTNIQVGYDTPLEVLEELQARLKAYVAPNNREWSSVLINIDKMEYQNALTLIIAMERKWPRYEYGKACG